MSRDEIEQGRNIWPPDIEKILSHYYKAEALDPKDFMTYKDRARLFHVLRQHEKSKEEYQKWFNLGSGWEDEVTKEIEMRKIEVEKGKRFKNITPWEYLEKYFAGDTKVDPTTRGMKKKNILKKLDGNELKSLGFTEKEIQKTIKQSDNNKHVNRNYKEGKIFIEEILSSINTISENKEKVKKMREEREAKSANRWESSTQVFKVDDNGNKNKKFLTENQYRKVKSQIIEKPKKIFKTNTDENEKMREELIEKFIDDKYFKEIFPKLEINLKKISNKKILELIDKL
jgi:hypothetical protein